MHFLKAKPEKTTKTVNYFTSKNWSKLRYRLSELFLDQPCTKTRSSKTQTDIWTPMDEVHCIHATNNKLFICEARSKLAL